MVSDPGCLDGFLRALGASDRGVPLVPQVLHSPLDLAQLHMMKGKTQEGVKHQLNRVPESVKNA